VEEELSLIKTLSSRRERYGSFNSICSTTQGFKHTTSVIINSRLSREYVAYPAYIRESLDMIFHKIARVLHGDPMYKDNWVDIVGYAQLVVEELEKAQQQKQ
jgi:hypothetical protein